MATIGFGGETFGKARKVWSFTDEKGKTRFFNTKKALNEYLEIRYVPRLIRQGFVKPVRRKGLKRIV